MAGAERASGSAKDDTGDVVAVAQGIEVTTKLDEKGRRERIELVGSVEGEGGDATVVTSDHEGLGHRLGLPVRRCRCSPGAHRPGRPNLVRRWKARPVDRRLRTG